MKGIGAGKNRTMMLAVSLALIMAVCGLFAAAAMTDSKDSSADTIAINTDTEVSAFALHTSGDIIEVNASYTLTADRTLNAGVKLVIASGQTLTVPAGITLTNNGTIDSKAGALAGTGSTVSASGSVVKVKSMDKADMIGSFKFETGSKFCILDVCIIGNDDSCSLKLENGATVSISASDAGVNYVVGEGGGAKATIIGDFGATADKFTFKNTDVVTVYSNTTLIVNSGKELVVDTGATLTNNGTINNGTKSDSNGTITNKGTLINKGSISLNYTSPLVNTGTIVNGGSIGGDANITHNGTFYAMVKIIMNGGKAGVLDTIYGKIKRGTSDPMELLNPDWQTPAGNIAREGYTFNGFNKSPMPLSSGAKHICGENRIPIANATPYVEETQAKWKLISVIGLDIYADWYIKTPEAPTASITNSSSKSVTVGELPDMTGFTRQYSDGTTWQDNNVFDNLTPGKVGGYTFKTRYNGSDFTYARGSLEATAASAFNFYELKYNENDGNALPDTVKTQYVEYGNKLTIHNFAGCTRDGCTPVGWNENANLSSVAEITNDTVFGSNKTAYVIWQLDKPAKASIAAVADRQININTQASTVTGAVTKYYKNGTENTDDKFSSLMNGTSYGFTLKFTKGILTTVTDSEASDVFSGAVYKITYSVNGGSGDPIDAQYWGTGMDAITPQEYSGIRQGFALQSNWFTGTNGTGTEYAKNSPSISGLTSNLDLNATWKANAPTDFEATGAGDKSITLAATAPEGASVKYCRSGEDWGTGTITLPSNGIQYTFKAKSVAGDDSNFIESEPMTLQKTVWTLKYDKNGGTGEIGDVYLPNGSSVQADSGALFERIGYTREKWYPNANGTGTPVNLNQNPYTPSSDNTTLYMKWTPITYTIAFAAGANGAGNITQIPATYGDSYEIPATGFTGSAGYVFAGWKLTGDATYGDNKYGDAANSINKSITGAETLIKNSAGAAGAIFVKDLCATSGKTVTLTAQFEHLNYNILFKLYEGSTVNNPDSINDVPYGTLKQITTPARDGYTFMGWKMSGGNTASAKWNTLNGEGGAMDITADSFANAVYADPVYVYNLTQTNGANVTLTGQWKQFHVYYPEGVSSVKVGGVNATSGVTTVVPGQSITWTVDTDYTVQSLNVTSGKKVDKVGDVVFTAQKGSAAIVVPPAGNGSATLPAGAPEGTYLFDVGTNMSVEMAVVLGTTSIGTSPKIVVTLVPVPNNEGQFEFTIVGGSSATTAATMKVTLPCDPSKGVPQVFWLDGGKKVPMKVVSVGKNSVTFETDHNSIYEIGYFVPPQIVKGSVKVTLNSNGGSMDGFMLGVKYNSTYGALPTPTKSGFEFVGWYYNGNPVTPNTPVQSNADHTLEAVWAEIEVEPEPQGSMLNSAAVAIAAAAAGMVLLFSFYVVIRARKS